MKGSAARGFIQNSQHQSENLTNVIIFPNKSFLESVYHVEMTKRIPQRKLLSVAFKLLCHDPKPAMEIILWCVTSATFYPAHMPSLSRRSHRKFAIKRFRFLLHEVTEQLSLNSTSSSHL